MDWRWAPIVGLLISAVALSGCSGAQRTPAPAATAPSREPLAWVDTSSVEPTTAALPSPFDGKALPLVSLGAALSQISGRVSLPETRVVGAPRAVVVNHARPKTRNALWLYYDPGVFFEVEPLPEGESEQGYAARRVAAASAMTHPDGTPCVTLRWIRGRETAVTTPGELLQNGQRMHVTGVSGAVAWASNGRLYLVRGLPLGLHGEPAEGSPSLGVLLRFAEAIP